MDQFDTKEKVKQDDLQIDLNYITQCQVSRKRQDLFVKKVLYQNQLTALKQKGKRLLMCERLDAQASDQQLEFLKSVDEMRLNQEKNIKKTSGGIRRANTSDLLSDEELKNFVEYLEGFSESFNKKSVLEQEDTVMRHRAKLIKGILSRGNFQHINSYLDLKIKYDQRFFQKGYAQYQQFMSDVRKQICINEQILRLRENLKKLQEQLDLKNKSLFNQMTDSNQKQQKLQEIQEQNELLKTYRFQAEKQYKELNIQLQKDSEAQKNKLTYKDKLMLQNYKAVQPTPDKNDQSKIDDDKSYKNAHEEALNIEKMPSIKCSQNDGGNMLISDAFESKKQSPMTSQIKKSKKSTTFNHEDQEANLSDEEDSSSDQASFRQNEVLSKIDSSYPTFADDDEENIDTSMINCENSIDQVHKSVVRNMREDTHQSESNAIIDKMRDMIQQSIKSKGPGGSGDKQPSLFLKLAHAVSQADEKCPLNIEIRKVKSKIVRKRARIHMVQTEGQKSLWGKDASYEPAEIYKESRKSMASTQQHNKNEA